MVKRRKNQGVEPMGFCWSGKLESVYTMSRAGLDASSRLDLTMPLGMRSAGSVLTPGGVGVGVGRSCPGACQLFGAGRQRGGGRGLARRDDTVLPEGAGEGKRQLT